MESAEAAPSTGPADTPAPGEPGERVYFPELDGLRFIAFVMVFLFHGGLPEAFVRQIIGRTAARALRENGGYGVQLFFILSGYLITTLLLREEARYGRVALCAFWVRRILRIWPLYYLVILIGFFAASPRSTVSSGRAAIATSSASTCCRSWASWATGRWPWSGRPPTGSACSGASASRSSST